jgi:NADPH:quinone reductase-like Zn-dependent oxidoreductase
MRAVMFLPRPDGADVEVMKVPDPVPKPGEVLVRVRAAGLNRGELQVRRQLRSGDPQATGIEFAGEVIRVRADPPEGRDSAPRFACGDRVMGHWRGGQAELVSIDERLLVPIPDRLSWTEAGGWLNVFVTAHDAMVSNAAIKAGESVLVNAGSSGIGIAALQIARLKGAAPIIASSRSAAKLERLRQYGMQVPALAPSELSGGSADHRTVLDATSGRGVDVLIDCVGGATIDANLRLMALRGRIVSVGRLGGNHGTIDLDYLALRRLRLLGVTFRTRTLEERIDCVQRCAADLLEPLARGQLQPVVDEVFPFDQVAAAHDAMLRDEHVGKIVLELSQGTRS